MLIYDCFTRLNEFFHCFSMSGLGRHTCILNTSRLQIIMIIIIVIDRCRPKLHNNSNICVVNHSLTSNKVILNILYTVQSVCAGQSERSPPPCGLCFSLSPVKSCSFVPISHSCVCCVVVHGSAAHSCCIVEAGPCGNEQRGSPRLLSLNKHQLNSSSCCLQPLFPGSLSIRQHSLVYHIHLCWIMC